MANIIGNNNMLPHAVNQSNTYNNNNSSGSNNIVVVAPNHQTVAAPLTNRLRDVCNFLQPTPLHLSATAAGGCPYDHIIDMIRGLDLQDDGIVMNHKIKSIEMDFCNIVRDENMLCESMDYINDKVLEDGDTSLKFALLFSSRNFDALAMNETKVRSAMLKILETNFLNADTYRLQNKERLYNSITLLGEYYHRVRLADNSPIIILGESLLGLLLREVSDLDVTIDVKLAKLILSQITLNGDAMRVKHKGELTQLLYHIRRNLIEQPVLKPAVKALLLMTLDLYYSNFANLGAQLEEMYTKYLVQDEEDEGNNNLLLESVGAAAAVTTTQQLHHSQPQQTYQQQHQQLQHIPPTTNQMLHQQDQQTLPCYAPDTLENGKCESAADDSYESAPLTKKWSEQVCEDSFYENDNEFGNELQCDSSELNLSGVGSGSNQDKHNSSYSEQLLSSSSRNDNERDSSSRNSRRSYNQQRNSPRPLKQTTSNSNDANDDHHQQSGEERDQTKPLPRWRAPRFNRDNTEQQDQRGGVRNQQRRFSASFDDDHHSVRSEGGSIRLYSINDRLKHSQEKIDRSSGNTYNSIANSNWDRQSQRDDRSERSYISNYERGNNNRRGGRNYNNRQMYDKPPRFQKNQQQQQQHNNSGDRIRSDTWRRSNANSANSYHDENSSYPSNGPESNSRSSSRARTLPRPGKSNFDGQPSPSHRQVGSSQSPTQFGNYSRGGSHNRGRNYNTQRYSSQSSLASEASSTLERRHHRHTQRHSYDQHAKQQPGARPADWEDTHSVHGQPEESSWNNKDNNSELVRNARNTTKYMNYLSAKK